MTDSRTRPDVMLADLLGAIETHEPYAFEGEERGEGVHVPITGLTADSRAVQPGFIFAGLRGAKADGARFSGQAVSQGAAALLLDADAALDTAPDVPVIRAQRPRQEPALLAAAFYGRQPDTAVAVTGTSGKTSVVDFARQIMIAAGCQAASVGTIGVIKPDGAVYGSLTTPDPVTLQKNLAALADEGISHLAFEASSHGLDQHRLDGVWLKAGAFTNLGRDHMDYHPTVEAYFAAKMRLFNELLPPGAPAVINADGACAGEARAVAQRRGLSVLNVGRAGDGIRLRSARPDQFRQVLDLEVDGREVEIVLPLIGNYQVENALVAAGLALSVGISTDQVGEALHGLKGVAGRLEVIGSARGGLAVVDYAHKPEALAAALEAVRPFVTGKLICVFGCGGDRDRGKRPLMGRIAVDNADAVIVTDDNPRTEAPKAIRKEILSAAPGAVEIGDRRAAIRAGVDMLGPGDVLVVAGKGHETGQIIGEEVLPFSDQDELLDAIRSTG